MMKEKTKTRNGDDDERWKKRMEEGKKEMKDRKKKRSKELLKFELLSRLQQKHSH